MKLVTKKSIDKYQSVEHSVEKAVKKKYQLIKKRVESGGQTQ